MMFAAGFGTRMKELTRDRPKPLIEVGGRALIDHTLALARAAGCAPIVANLHYKAEMLEAHLAPLGVQTVSETPDILDTGGGLRNALPLLGTGPVVTLNTDAIWSGPSPVSLLQQAWEPGKMDALLLCLPPAQALGHGGQGDFLLQADGRLERGPGLVYGGIQIIRTEGLKAVAETVFSLNLAWNEMQARGRLYGISYPGRWCDVGHPGGIALAESLLDSSDV